MSPLETDPCEVCTKETAESFSSDFDGVHQLCPRCGEFKLSRTAGSVLRRGVGQPKRAKLSGWVREQNLAGATPMITTNTLESVFERPLPPVSERALGLLREAESGLESLGDGFNINEPRFLAASYSTDSGEVSFLLRMLSDLGLAEAKAMGGQCEISPAGYMKLDELRGSGSSSSQGFVAMWFGDSLKIAYEDGFEVGVFRAGYDPVRMDRIEHINRIDDEIIRQINASRFVVADFTGHRGGVYFEAGYALGRDMPVFWSCRKSDIGELHFDIRQFNCIDWDSPAELADRLSSRIEAVLGAGPKKAKE